MKCPNCGIGMEQGNLQTSGSSGLFYMPQNMKYGIFPTVKKVEKAGGLVLDGPYQTRLNHTNVPCFRCHKCKKIIISY